MTNGDIIDKVWNLYWNFYPAGISIVRAFTGNAHKKW